MTTRPIIVSTTSSSSTSATSPAATVTAGPALSPSWQIAKNLPAWDLLPAAGTIIRRVSR